MTLKLFKSRCFTLFLAVLLIGTLIVPAYAADPPGENELYSRAAFVMDANTGEELWSKNPDLSLIPASITKIMTAYLVLEAIEDGQFSFDSIVPISSRVSSLSYNSRYSNVPLSTQGTYTISQLLEAMIVSSACAAAQALAEFTAGSEAAFVDRMNLKASEMGIDCKFYDCYGGSTANRVTARSLATLCHRLIQDYPEYLTYSCRPAYTFAGHTYQSTNHFVLGNYSCNGTVDGIKTGTLTAAGYCLCSTAYNDTDRVIVITLNSPYAYRNFDDHVKLINFGLAAAGENNTISYLEPFIDVPLEIWYTGAVETAYQRGLMLGTSINTFEPETALSRAMMVQLLYNLEQKPDIDPESNTFTDVSQEFWYYSAVEWAASQGLILGRGEGIFDPNTNITRQEMVLMLYRYHQYKERNPADNVDLSTFIDSSSISDFALPAMKWAISDNIIHGTGDSTLAPLSTATRAEVATMMVNYVNLFATE